MKILIYANVDVDWKGIIRTPYGIAQFRSYISRHFITSDLPYNHPSGKAVPGDIIVWSFKDEKDEWYLLGDGFVSDKWKPRKGTWAFGIEGARLYPRSVALTELAFASSARKSLNVSVTLKWNQYQKILEKAAEPLV